MKFKQSIVISVCDLAMAFGIGMAFKYGKEAAKTIEDKIKCKIEKKKSNNEKEIES